MPQLLYERSSPLSDLEKTADDILQFIRGTNILLLQGDLGSGKTSLVKQLLKRLGVTSGVTSPTFNLVNEYRNDSGKQFYHFDLYRIKNVEELSEIGFYEYIDSGNLCIIEWPEIAEGLLSDKVLKLHITHQDDKRLYELWMED